MMKYFYIICFLILVNLKYPVYIQGQVGLSVDFSKKGVDISPSLYGIFFEDINFAADGGLYAELIRNRSFEESTNFWSMLKTNSSKGNMTLENQSLLNAAQSYCLKITADSIGENGLISIQNAGFWGINLVEKTAYNLSFYAKSDENYTGVVVVSLINTNGTIQYAQQRISGLTPEWKKYTCTLVSNGNNPAGKFSIGINAVGKVWLDVVSLFPPTYKNRLNGLRMDLAEKLKELHPKFVRFPGGCFVEGDILSNRFQWKNTIGSIENRPGHKNFWGYRTSDGLGYHEFLLLTEDLGSVSLFVVNVGIAHNEFVTYTSIDEYIQEALDAIEYANGPTSSTYGAMRAANGHPEPFNLRYIEIGNENNQNVQSDHYFDRYIQFYNAIKAKYPDIICVGDVEAWGTDYPSWKSAHPVDYVDEHYYRTTEWFASKADKYDSYSRTGPKIYVGEYAVTTGGGKGNLGAALGEAAYMTGMEKNSDIVVMASYAPLLGNVNNCQWNPDAIYYNSSESYGTPSYHVQNMFANNIGNKNIPVIDTLNSANSSKYNGAIGVATWATKSQYDSVTVLSGDSVIVNENFDIDASAWTTFGGTWAVNNGVYEQTSTNTDCRSTTGNISLPRFTYHLKARKTSGSEGFLIIFGYQNDNNFYWWNIGGWANTLSAIEKATNGSKVTLASSNLVVSPNKWYDIKIEIINDTAKFYLDNALIHTIVQSEKFLYTACSVDSVKGDIYLKVVNYSNSDKSATIHFKNLPENTSLEGQLQTMTYSDVLAENTISDPDKIVPVSIDFSSGNTGFQYSFLARSVNVFHLFPQSNLLLMSGSTYSIPENSGIGYEIGTISTNSGSRLEFSIVSSSLDGAFEINDSTGNYCKRQYVVKL